MRKHVRYLFALLLLAEFPAYTQTFPNPITLSTGQGAQGTFDPVWQVSEFWYATAPSPIGLNYSPALINGNCAPGAWVDAATLPAPTNNGNWITGPDADCANNTSDGYRFFRLTLDLPADCNGFSVTVAGNYVLSFDGYVDNQIGDVYINGTPQGISGGGYATGSQLTFTLNGPWLVGTNYVDISVFNAPAGGGSNPYGLLLVANTTAPVDTDGDGVPNVSDLCPCDPGNNAVGCMDPANPNGCDIDAIRTAFTNAGCIEMSSCVDDCSMYFLNPQALSGSAAQAFAQTLGSNLVSVQSQAENNCIVNSLTDMGQTGVIWIGFNDEDAEGNFVWYDQSPVVYTNWAPGEPNNSGDEDCTQIYPDGMWNDLSSSTANAQSIIEVNLCPVVNIGPDITLCAGATANLNVNSMLFGSPVYSYTWSNGVQTAANPIVPAVSTEFRVISIDRYQCETSDTIQVTVNPLPIVGAGADQVVCTGTTVTLSGSGAASYAWDNGVTDGTAFNPTATATYTVTGTDTNGCVNTDQMVVTVNPLPPVSAGNDVVICLNDPVTLAGSGAANYVWDNGVTDAVAFNPTATTTYTVTGTDANGCSNTDQVTVTVNPLPVVGAGNDAVICLNDPVTLAGSGATNYTWDNGVTDGTAFNPTSTATYTITGTDANGCINSDQVTVTVNPLPVVGAGNDAVICLNDPVILAGSGAASYVWDNGITDATAFNPTATTTYTVTGTDANGCVNTDQVTVTVNPLPVVGAGNDVVICLNGPVTLTGSGATSYVWNNGVTDGTAFNPTATATYTVTGTDVNGCVNTDQVDVTVNPLPPVSAGNDVVICLNDPVTLAGSGAANYVWDNGGIDGVSFNPTTTTLYTVTGTDANGCVNTDQVNVTVHPLPVVSAGADRAVCMTDPVTLAGSGAMTYLWDNGGIDGVAFTPTATTTYTVTGTDVNGCVNTDQVIVTVNPLPDASFSAGAVAGCLPVTIPFTPLVTDPGASYDWSFGDGATAASTGISFHNYTGAGCFTVGLTVTSAAGCVTQQQQNNLICIAPDPEAAFSFSPGDLTILDTEISLDNTSLNATGYSWEFGDGTGSTATSPSHLYPVYEAGSYEVMLVASNLAGCTDTAYATVIIREELIYYVPNTFTPDGNEFNQTFMPVFSSGIDPFNYNMKIFNRWGEIIFETNDLAVGWDGSTMQGPAKSDVYTWKIDFSTSNNTGRQSLAGHISLLR